MNIDFNKYINLRNIPQDQQAQFINSITTLVLARMADMIGDHLAEEEVVSLEQLTDSGDQNAVLQWLASHIPNFEQGVSEILSEECKELGDKIGMLTDYSFSKG